MPPPVGLYSTSTGAVINSMIAMYKRSSRSTYGTRKRRKIIRKAKPRRRVTRTRRVTRMSKMTRIKAAGMKPDRSIPIKRFEIDSDNNMQLKNTRQLYQGNLIYIPLQTTADELDKRDTSRVTVAGVRLNWFWRMPLLQSVPLWVNIAIVIPRNALVVDETALFRAYTGEREQDFALSQSWWRFNFPINKDRYEVIMHKRFLLAPNSHLNGNVTDVVPNARSIHNMKMYQKINRQFTYDDAVGGEPRQAAPIVIHWYDALGAAAFSASAVNKVELTRSTVVYYKED